MLCQEFKIEIVGEFEIPEMYLEYFLSLLKIRKFDVNLSVKTSCTHKSLVKNVGTVGCGKDDYARVRTETVHLCKKLIKGVFTLIV